MKNKICDFLCAPSSSYQSRNKESSKIFFFFFIYRLPSSVLYFRKITLAKKMGKNRERLVRKLGKTPD